MDSEALLDALPVAVYTTDAEGRITYYNQAAVELWGWRPEIGISRWCGSWRLFSPDGQPLVHEACPMAVALKEGQPIRGSEVVAERPDGTRVHFLPFPTPIRDKRGRVIGGINLLMDISERRQAEAMSARLAAIVSSSDDAIISKTLDGRITSWNAGATAIFGYEPGEIIGQPITRIIPEDLLDQEREIIARLRRGERIAHYETVRVAKDGRKVDISLTVSPLRDRSGQVIGASKVARDISERKHAERMQSLLANELNHRVKNTLATVQSIASQSLSRARSPEEFASGFSGRLQALARAHDLLTRTKFEGAEIMQLIREQVSLSDADSQRIGRVGPTIMLDAQTATHLALVLHELATNARKYGALSVPEGRLSVKWELRTDDGRTLVVDWKERNGPKVNAPSVQGFGSTLMAQSLQGRGGKVAIRYRAEGVTARITLPLAPLPHARVDLDLPANATRAELLKPLLLSAQHPPSEGKRIILLEDEPLASMDMESRLENAGHKVVGVAATLDRSKALCAHAECDAALLDANLMGQPVDELAACLTARGIPFAFVTGYGREALPQAFREAMLLKKPFSQEELLGTLELLLRQAPGVTQLRAKEGRS